LDVTVKKPALILLLMVATTVAGCGTSSKTTAASSGGARPGGFQAYTSCLSQHGVTLPSAFPRGTRPSGRPSNRPSGFPSGRPSGAPRGGGFGFGTDPDQPPAGVDADTWKKALSACAALRPSGGPQNRGANTAYRNCLADHGVTASRGPGELDPNDPKVAAAMKACEALRPTSAPMSTHSP